MSKRKMLEISDRNVTIEMAWEDFSERHKLREKSLKLGSPYRAFFAGMIYCAAQMNAREEGEQDWFVNEVADVAKEIIKGAKEIGEEVDIEEEE